MSSRLVLRLALPALAGTAIWAAPAAAAPTTLPTPTEARTFATTNGGWTSAVDYGGLVCIPGVTCPTATPSYRTTGGTGGATDGHLRNTFGTLLGVMSTTTISWTSPSFVAPAGTDIADLTFKVRPQIASLLAIGSVTLSPRLVDVDNPADTIQLPPRQLTTASASFGPQSFTVPAASIVAGRTYRVQIGVSHTTKVSAVTSGNVDIDDVVLTLDSLAGPRDLTATVPSTGPVRVTGTVDAHGFDTDVTVEYGTTTAYGATTTRVTLPGSTSGAQDFSVPLTGLTPGQTYHYRVKAENTEGPVTTTDATFVAPSPPSSAVPTVTGAANSRVRTVTFARAADVTAAVVELVDTDGTVQQSWTDTNGDGSESITLPDTDGTYALRVRRTSNRGLESTSATVPVTLDRVGPSVSGLALAVTPAASPSRSRTVSLTAPSDAVSVSAQVIDADDAPVGAAVPVAAGSAAVQLGTADGTYRVRISLTDSAGNATTATSSALVLDTVNPIAGPAPTVTGEGRARGRTVTFERDSSAATVEVEILDANDVVVDTVPVASGASADVTLPDADGAYGIRVRQVDAAGNQARTSATGVILDRVAPAAGPAPTVTGAATGRTRTVTFTRDATASSVAVEILRADGSVAYTVSVTAGGDIDVTLPDADGTYGIRVRQTDAAGNAATTGTVETVLDRVAPDAGPAPAVTGVGNERRRKVAFTRDVSAATVTVELLGADGTIIDTIAVPTGDSADVTLPDADGTYGIRIRQVDAAGNSARTSTTDVLLDRVAPAAGPAPSVPTDTDGSEPITVTFVRAADAVDVVVEVRDASGALVRSIPVPTGDRASGALPAAAGLYRLRVVQTDAAGNRNESAETTVERRTPAAAPDAPTATPPAAASPVQGASAACRRPATALTVVSRSGKGVTVRGFTSSPAGASVVIVDGANQPVGTAVVGADGSFSATVAPTKNLRRGQIRYRILDGGRSSSAAQLDRANRLQTVRRTGETVTLTGRVNLRRVGRIRSITALGGSGACPDPVGTFAPVGRAKVDAQGRYRLTVRAAVAGRLVIRTRVQGTRAPARSVYVVR